MVCSPQNLFLWFSRNQSSFPCTASITNFTCIDTKPRAQRVSRCQDIHRNLCAPPAAEETQIQNRQLRPARLSDLGLGCLRFHLRQPQWPSGNVRQLWLRGLGFESWQFRIQIQKFYNSEWHERAFFLHLPKDTCATAIGQPNRLRVLPFHCCASDWFKTF